ncbi:MAG: 50S ribosomal protein L4 [Candidatus Firestonebacteria bacterium GWA2_43_8]|nr:MAG: 50S ribosomal protein L4 [Candidatus Firestonebacteria bacterium GWA2_43_8]
MPKLKVLDMAGKEVGDISLKDDYFGIAPRKDLITEAVLNELNNERRGTVKVKTRGEVSGGGKKPWNQKGTGRARQGSTRSIQWRHGGVAHGPKQRKFGYTMPEKVKKIAYCSIMSEKIKENALIIVSEMTYSKPKTKDAVSTLKNLKAFGLKTLVVSDKKDDVLKKSMANLDGSKLIYLTNINCHDLLNYERLVFTKDAILNLEKQLEK